MDITNKVDPDDNLCVRDVLDRLRVDVDGLRVVLSELFEKLAPVLLRGTPEPVIASAPLPDHNAELVCDISKINGSILDATSDVLYFANRIKL